MIFIYIYNIYIYIHMVPVSWTTLVEALSVTTWSSCSEGSLDPADSGHRQSLLPLRLWRLLNEGRNTSLPETKRFTDIQSSSQSNPASHFFIITILHISPYLKATLDIMCTSLHILESCSSCSSKWARSLALFECDFMESQSPALTDIFQISRAGF
jgi:hypothetical protein